MAKRKNEASGSKQKRIAFDEGMVDDISFFLTSKEQENKSNTQSKSKKSLSKIATTPSLKSQGANISSIKSKVSPLTSNNSQAANLNSNKSKMSPLISSKPQAANLSSNKSMVSIDSLMLKSRDLEIKQIKDNLNSLDKRFKASQKTVDEKFESLNNSSDKIIQMVTSLHTAIVSLQSNKHLLTSQPVANLEVELCPNSSFKIKQSILDAARAGKSATVLALTILPGLCTVAEVYRATVSGTAARVNDDRKVLFMKKKKINTELRDALHSAAMYYKFESYSKQILNIALSNHLRHLTNLFLSLRDGHNFSEKLLKANQVTTTHLKFKDMVAYVKTPSKFFDLDRLIENDGELGPFKEMADILDEKDTQDDENESSENDAGENDADENEDINDENEEEPLYVDEADEIFEESLPDFDEELIENNWT